MIERIFVRLETNIRLETNVRLETNIRMETIFVYYLCVTAWFLYILEGLKIYIPT